MENQTRIIDSSFKNYSNIKENSTILLIDIDSFDIQIYDKPEYIGKPRVVSNSAGRITAVSYEAKALGLNRVKTHRVEEALELIPHLIVIFPPNNDPDAPNTFPERKGATERVSSALCRILSKLGHYEGIEVASSDEFYLDITQLIDTQIHQESLSEKSFFYSSSFSNDTSPLRNSEIEKIVRESEERGDEFGKNGEIKLLGAFYLASHIAKEVYKETSFQVSIGIGVNKLVAKLACGLHKPSSVTGVAPSGFINFSKVLPIESLPGLGRKIGKIVKESLKITTLEKLHSLSIGELISVELEGGKNLGTKMGQSIIQAALGLCNKKVIPNMKSSL